jgi:hypothetical protein
VGLRAITALPCVFLALPLLSLRAETPAPQMGVVYECMGPYSFKFYSCTGTGANDVCDVQSIYAGHPFQRGKSTYPQVMGLLPRCHLQTPAEAQADARSALTPLPNMANQSSGPGGFKIGDTVRVLMDGWQTAQILQVHGVSYVVRMPKMITSIRHPRTFACRPRRSARPRNRQLKHLDVKRLCAQPATRG